MKTSRALSACLALIVAVSSAEAQVEVLRLPSVGQMASEKPRWVDGTIVQLSVIDAVNSKRAKAGDRFKLRVEAPVCVDGKIAIPIGATAWGVVMSSFGASASGARGRLSWLLREVDTAWGPLPIHGEQEMMGASGADSVAVAVYLVGISGFLLKGKNAGLRAGETLSGYISSDVPASEQPILIANRSGMIC